MRAVDTLECLGCVVTPQKLKFEQLLVRIDVRLHCLVDEQIRAVKNSLISCIFLFLVLALLPWNFLIRLFTINRHLNFQEFIVDQIQFFASILLDL